MGVKELREAFNEAAAPHFTASKAFLQMVRVDSAEMTKLTFSGIGADGVAFEVTTDPLPAGTDVMIAAKQAAGKLVEDRTPKLPPPEEPPP